MPVNPNKIQLSSHLQEPYLNVKMNINDQGVRIGQLPEADIDMVANKN